jgi:hypothetical protein
MHITCCKKNGARLHSKESATFPTAEPLAVINVCVENMAKKTNKSNRKRQAVYATKIDLKKSGIEVPDHIKSLKDPRKHFRKEEFNAKVVSLMENLNNLQRLLENALKNEQSISNVDYNNLLTFNYRSAVIQYFVILDETINSILTQHQFEIDVPLDETRHYSKVDDGINDFLPQEDRPPLFDKKYSRIKHFRVLRNQFAHFSEGAFILDAKQESFESFLSNLEGIELTTKGGFHGYLDGKPGMSLPYQFNSGEYVHTLLQDGAAFLQELMDVFFTEETN